MGNPYLKALEEYKHGQKFICVKTGKESIVIEKVNGSDKVYLRIIYTSPETQNIADLGVRYLVNDFKKKNYTK